MEVRPRAAAKCSSAPSSMPDSGSHRRSRVRNSVDDELRGDPLHAADVWLFVTVCYGLLLFVLTHLSPDSIPEFLRFAPGNDVYAHGVAYFFLAALVCRTFDAQYRRSSRGMRAPVFAYALVFCGCALFGIIDEETQPLAGRTADAADWEADLFGAAFGVCAHLVIEIFLVDDARPIRRRRRRRRSRRHESGRSERRHHETRRREGRRTGRPGHGEDRSHRRERREPFSPPEAPQKSGLTPPDDASPRDSTTRDSSGSSGKRRRRRRESRRRRKGGDSA